MNYIEEFKKMIEERGAVAWGGKPLNKADVVEMMKHKEDIKKFEFEDSYGWYRDLYIIFTNGERVRTGIDQRSCSSVQKILYENEIEYTS